MKKETHEVGEPLKNVGLVSIIVPVYNVAKFLPRSLDSILQQTYPYWEAILVNDGSTDNSLEILQQYAKQDSRFKVINKENGRAASARNAGLDVAHGEYTAFFDSDDMLYPQFLEIMLKALIQSGSDMVWCKSKDCSEDAGLEFCSKYDKYEITKQNTPLNWYFSDRKPRLPLTVWCKICKTKLLSGLRFSQEFKSLCEDGYYSLQTFERCVSVSCVRKYLMAYRQNSASAMHKKYSFKRVDDEILMAKLTLEWMHKYACLGAARKKFAEHIFEYSCYQPYVLGLENYMDFWNKYSQECRQLVADKVFFPQYLPLYKRVMAHLFMRQKWSALRFMLHLYRKFRKS